MEIGIMILIASTILHKNLYVYNIKREHEESPRGMNVHSTFCWIMCDQQSVLWGRLLKILKETVYESKAFGLYFTDIKEPAQNSKLIEL